MIKPSFGIIVGRFQVHELHDGHIELIQTVRGLHNRVIVFLGVAPAIGTRRNPLDFITRKKLIQASFPDVTVCPLPDMVTDEAWSRELDHRIAEIAPFGEITLYGGRDSFVPHYSGKYKPMELPLKIQKSGEEVRAELGGTVMASPDFRAGVIYSTANQYPRVITTVDIAILSNSGKLLLGRKKDEKGWRFIGGHADPKSDRFEQDAYRESARGNRAGR
jgi:bifunctional NMN adenylyltransferase/nudix hydrolase